MKDDNEYLETTLAHIIEYLPAHIYWKDMTGRYLGCNTMQAKNLGLQSNVDIIGRTDFELPWPDNYAEEFRQNDIEVIKNGKIKITEEKSIMDGKDVIVLSQKVPLKSKEGDVIGILGVSVDISDRKEIERLRIENQANHDLQLAWLRKVAAQVAHDIRSPAASLNMLMSLCTDIKEEDRVAIRRAITRINDIANNLLGYFILQPDAEGPFASEISNEVLPLLISVDLLEIITEKRYEYSQLPVGFISNFSSDSYFTFIAVQGPAFARAMSNLINNAVEAFEGKCGEVIISLDIYEQNVRIIIEDRGKGISDVVISKIRSAVAVTDGKIEGHGIGYSQIRSMLEQNNGTLDIQSDLTGGTKVTITFPKVDSPNWIADRIELNSDDLIIILDDDPSIHGAWERRFAFFAPGISRRHFEQGTEAIEFLNQLADEEKKKVFLLTDYELLKQDLHGLNVIEKTKIERSILVTSHYNNLSVRELAAMTQTRILPKLLASEIAIVVNEDN